MSDIETRLENWKKWLALRDWMPPRYRTILGMLFRAPQRNHWDAPVAPPPPIDHLDAALIEKAIHKLPERNQTVIILQYLGQMADGERVRRKIARMEKYRICGIPERTFYREVHRSKLMIKNILRIS